MDYTLWPYFCDAHVNPPINKRKINHQEQVVDSCGFLIRGYSDVTKILKTLKEHCLEENQHLAVASRSTTRDLCMQSIELLGWKEFFSSFQIYPTNKITHMKAIREELKFKQFEEVLFFDDDYSNIKSTSSIGVYAYEVDQQSGVNITALVDALNKFGTGISGKNQHLLNV